VIRPLRSARGSGIAGRPNTPARSPYDSVAVVSSGQIYHSLFLARTEPAACRCHPVTVCHGRPDATPKWRSERHSSPSRNAPSVMPTLLANVRCCECQRAVSATTYRSYRIIQK
jgi:hypothetical protein